MTGEVTIPVTSDGVLALDEYAAIALLTLGVTPETTSQFYGDFYDAGENAVIEASGTTYIPPDNLEALAAAAPSLMVGIGHPNFEPFIDEHRAIAPTVYPMFQSRWDEQTRVFAEVTGTTERADAVIGAIEARTEEVRQIIADNGFEGAEVSLLQTFPGEFYAYNESPLGGSILKDLGFTRPEFQLQEDEFGFLLFSEEELPSQTQSDIVLWISVAAEENLFENPLVDLGDRIGVAVNGLWTSNHALGAWLMLEDVARAVTGQPAVQAGAEVAEQWDALLAAIDAIASGEPAPADDAAGDDVADDEASGGESAAGSVVDVATANGAGTIASYGSFAPGFDAAVSGDGPVTFLAPSEEAFAAIQSDFPDLVAQLTGDFDLLDSLLQYHVVEGVALAADVTAATEIPTLEGNTITVEVVDGEVVLNGGQARVIATDLLADNGVVHVIDRVLLPPELAASAS
ncbi:MAG: fasciclin domain-containing protein [Actinomycetota bacterium]